VKTDANLTVKFVENLSLTAEGMCLYWIKEVHIDKEHEGKPQAEAMIQHERKHYYFIQKALHTKSELAKDFWILLNNAWDFLDCFRIACKYPKAFPAMLFQYGAFFAVILYIVTKLVKS